MRRERRERSVSTCCQYRPAHTTLPLTSRHYAAQPRHRRPRTRRGGHVLMPHVAPPAPVRRVTPWAPTGLSLVSALLIVAGTFLYYQRTWHSVHDFMLAIDVCPDLFCDFTQWYYPMGRTILESRLPLPGFLYSPFFALLLRPLGLLPVSAASLLWGTIQLVMACALLALPAVALPWRTRWLPLAYLAVFITTYPVLDNLRWGQVSITLACATLGTLVLYQRGWQRLAAALLAGAISIKLYPAMFLVYFLLNRDFKFVARC